MINSVAPKCYQEPRLFLSIILCNDQVWGSRIIILLFNYGPAPGPGSAGRQTTVSRAGKETPLPLAPFLEQREPVPGAPLKMSSLVSLSPCHIVTRIGHMSISKLITQGKGDRIQDWLRIIKIQTHCCPM